MTQEDLGKLCGVTQGAVQKWESDVAYPTSKRWPRVADALGKPVAWFFGEVLEEDDLADLLKQTQRSLDRIAQQHAPDLPPADRPPYPGAVELLEREADALRDGSAIQPVKLARIAGVDVGKLLSTLRGQCAEDQLAVLRALYDRVEIHGGFLRFVLAEGLGAPVDRAMPRYYAPQRGKTDLGF